jgi:hypothetical protein
MHSKQSRLAESQKKARAMTARYSRAAHNTHREHGEGWLVVGVCDGLLKPEPVVLADQD